MALGNKKTGFTSRDRGTQVFKGLVLDGFQIPTGVSFTFAQSATQYGTTCEIAVVDGNGNNIAGVFNLDVLLTDSATGVGVTATDPNGTVAAKAASGVVLGTLTAKKVLRVQTLATGKFTLEILDDVTPVLLYVAAALPVCKICVSRKTVAGDYKP